MESSGDRHQLQECLELARHLATQEQARELFQAWREEFAANNPQAAELLTLLWEEVLSANRSALFWQELTDVEKKLSDRMTQQNIQLQQNYLRLVQEQ